MSWTMAVFKEVMLSLETITSDYLVGNTIRLTDAFEHSIFVHEFSAKRNIFYVPCKKTNSDFLV
jgi:hypothetical protein